MLVLPKYVLLSVQKHLTFGKTEKHTSFEKVVCSEGASVEVSVNSVLACGACLWEAPNESPVAGIGSKGERGGVLDWACRI